MPKDQTNLKDSENQRDRESESKYRKLFENSLQNIGIYEMVRDESGEIVDWILLDMNKPLEKQSGMPLESMRGKRITELWGMEASKESIARSREIMSSGKGQQFESPWGERRYLASYFPFGNDTLAAVGVDITERKRSEEVLKDSEAKYQALFENLNEAVGLFSYVFDKHGKVVDNIFLDVNQAMERSIGMRKDEVVGKSGKEVWGEQASKEYLPHVIETKETGKTVIFDSYFEPLDKYFLNIMVPLNDLQFISSSLDVTEIKKEQKRAEDYSEKLKRSNEELRQFAYVASHDLQEPLRMVSSYIGLLQKRSKNQLDDKAKEYMNFAVQGVDRMNQLIRDLLDLARVDSKGRALVPTDMNEVMNRTHFSLKASIDESRAAIYVDNLPTIAADEHQMMQLMQNLIGNAIKFLGEETPEIEISCTSERHYWAFSVKDNGIGIQMEYAEKIFDVFSRLHTLEEYSGTGIGLAIAKKIVERHGGRIWVQSEGEGKGSTFFFTIPKM